MKNTVSHHNPLYILHVYSWHAVTSKRICGLNAHEYKSVTAADLSVGPTTSVELTTTTEPTTTAIEPTVTTTELTTVPTAASSTAVTVDSTTKTSAPATNDTADTATQQGAGRTSLAIIAFRTFGFISSSAT